MNHRDGRERRSAVRIPVGCEATIVPPPPYSRQSAVCLDLSVDGMTLKTRYVPRPDEVFDVIVVPPGSGTTPGSARKMHVRVQVRRCQAIAGTGEFSLGVKILHVLR